MMKAYTFMMRTNPGNCILGVILWLMIAGFAGAQEGIPADLVIADTFAPGIGAPVGEVRLLQGEVVAVHEENADIGYPLTMNDPVFQGDTLYTGESGKVNVELNDSSRITLATRTRIVLNQNIYNPDQLSTRTSFISVLVGKVRFLVRNLPGLKNSDFKVRTKTAVVGVRGSDFVVEATDELTRVTALENTRIEVIGLAVPCPRPEDRQNLENCRVPPMLVTEFQQANVRRGDFPRIVAELGPEQIEIMKEVFLIDGEAGLSAKREEEPEIRVAEEDLSDMRVGTPQVDDAMLIPDVFSGEDSYETGDIQEDRAEDVLQEELERLPGFPGRPQ